jgi:hypothetical protein
LITVVGSSGYGRVAGVPSSSPAALLRVVADRPDTDVVVLTSLPAQASAQRQAELVAAARPSARVSVISSPHHALTLTVVADRVLTTAPYLTGPDELRRLLGTELARARSLVWSASAWRLRGVGSGIADRLRWLVTGRSPVLETGPSTDTGRGAWSAATGDQVYAAGPLPAPLADQLDPEHLNRVDTTIVDSRYAPGSAWLLTALPADADRAGSTPTLSPQETPIDRLRPPVVTPESEAA